MSSAPTLPLTRLGRTGLQISRLCLGCMSYGVPERGTHPWSLPEEASRPFIRRALDLGLFFFDTANVYSDGTSEEILGRTLRDFAPRDEVVIATKVHGRVSDVLPPDATDAQRAEAAEGEPLDGCGDE